MDLTPDRTSSSQAAAFKQYYRTVTDHPWVVVICVLVALLGAGVYVKLAPRKYSATAQMLVSPVPSDDSTMIGLPVLHATADPTNDVLTGASLMTNNTVATAAAHSLHLRGGSGGVLSDIQATPIGQSDLVALQATASSAKQAQAIANAFAHGIVSTRATALHHAIAAVIPGLRAQEAQLPPSERNGPGTIGDQISQLEQLASSPDPTITIASLASLPSAPYTPRTKLALVAGGVAGLLLGVAAAFALNALDPHFRREEQLQDVFGAPVMARIPRIRHHNGRPLLPDELPAQALEGYRTLRAVLQARSHGQPRVVLITSSAPAEGKTTSAINAAAALAQGGARVTLIEADLRRPTLARSLMLDPQFGTEDVLIGAADFDAALQRAEFGGVPLNVLAVRQAGTKSAARISAATAQRLIQRAVQSSDFVVLDTPPLTAVGDALPLAIVADERLVVARLGSSKLTKLSDLNDVLLDQGRPPTGVMLIGDSDHHAYDYYYENGNSAGRGRRRWESRQRRR